MGDVIKSAGWDIELIRCTHLEPAGADYAVFAVNLIVPHAAVEDPNNKLLYWVDGLPSAVCSGAEAVTALGDLLRPWRWENVKWTFHSSAKGNSGWTPVAVLDESSGIWPVEDDSRRHLRESLTLELDARTKDCKDAFSVDDPRWHGTSVQEGNRNTLIEQSWPHALAALTHTPAGLSNDALSVARFFRVRLSDLPAAQGLVAFPEFSLDGTAFTIDAVEARTQRLAAIYKPERNGTKLVMGSESVQDSTDLAALGAPLKEGKRGRGVIDRLFSAHLLPLEVLTLAIDQIDYSIKSNDLAILEMKVFPRVQWLLALFATLGTGWLRLRVRPPGKVGGAAILSRPHFLQFAFSAGQDVETLLQAYRADAGSLPQKLEAAFVPIKIEATSAVVLALFDRLNSRSSIDETTMKEMRGALEAPIADLPAGSSDEDRARRRAAALKFFAAWSFLVNEMLGDERGRLQADWLCVMLAAQSEAVPEPQKTAMKRLVQQLEKLDGLDYDSADQLLLGALDQPQTQAEIWPLLRDFVDARDVAAEDKALDKIVGEVEKGAKVLAPNAQLPSKFADAMKYAKSRFSDDYTLQGRRSGVRNHDEGLWLEFESKAPETTTVDSQIRGFSLALGGGVRSATAFWWDKSRAQWITQTAIRHYWKELDNSTPPKYVPNDALLKANVSGTSEVAWYAGTVGSSLVSGQRVGQALYKGAPVFSIAEKERKPLFVNDQEDIETLDFRWPTDGIAAARTPLLGYGVEFAGFATALDNAGGIANEELRDNPRVAQLKPADKLTLWDANPSEDQTIRYESRVPPGAPRLIAVDVRNLDNAPTSVNPTDLTDETRAVRYISAKLSSSERTEIERAAELVVGAGLPRVASLVHGAGKGSLTDLFLPQTPASVTLRLRPPLNHVSFIESWLATDRLILDSNFNDAEKAALISDPLFKDHAVEFEAFRLKMAEKPTEQCDYHPAVTAIGLELSFPATGGTHRQPPIAVPRTAWDGAQKAIVLAMQEIKLRVEVGTALQLPAAGNEWTLKLPPATFVRIRAYSLVEKDFFAIKTPLNARMRYAATVGEDAKDEWAGFRAFGPLEYWAESMPAWADAGDPVPEENYLPLKIDPPTLADAMMTRLVATAAADQRADWIRAVEIFRHTWHWTGYPVQFPPLAEAAKLESWLPAFAGVESKRQREVVELPSYVARSQWLYGNHAPAPGAPPSPVDLTLSTHTMSAGERPSRYAAYTVRPIVRFASWLAPGRDPRKKWPEDLTRDLFAAGNLVRGIGDYTETKRMPAPAFRYHIPLTATYSYDPDQKDAAIKLSRDNNGNLLIFADSIRRTDDFSRLGGIGDTIEVDLLQTRSIELTKEADPKQRKEREFSEIGPNPIFHPSPAAGLPPDQLEKMPQLTLQISEPFGLTFDLVRNAKVAQTAVTVRPGLRKGSEKELEQALRQWTLAKVRVRRIILPETQLDGELSAGLLAWRVDGLDRIPADFAVDGVAKAGARSLKITLGAEPPYVLEVPPDVEAGSKVRWLVSFHKGRWHPLKPAKQPGPYWAPQILVQVPRKQGAREVLGWKTVARSTCYGKEPWEWRDGTLFVEASGLDRPAVRIAQMSDYTDARWLLFMGRIPGTDKIREDQYALVPEVDGAKKIVALTVTGGSFGALRRPPQSTDDWKRPASAQPNEVIDTEFYVLFVSSATSDVIAGRTGTDDFGLLAFQPTDKPNRFVPLGPALNLTADKLKNANALLCGFQRITSTSAEERRVKIDTLPALMQAIFPDPIKDAEVAQRYPESIVRPTGSHWGPMPIVRTDSD
jgi:hypothetical protein